MVVYSGARSAPVTSPTPMHQPKRPYNPARPSNGCTSLAIAPLYQRKYDAVILYAYRKGKHNNEEQSWTEVFLSNLDELEAEGITLPDVTKIRAFLQK